MNETGNLTCADEYRAFIKETLDSYKCKAKYHILKELPVYDDAGELIAYLRPITSDYRKTIKDCALLMGNWRAENPSISDSVFDITVDRTEKWLDNLIIGRDDRLLFMIMTLEGRYIGHVGCSSFHYEDRTAEIDSILRGVHGVYPGIMTFAIRTLLWWGINVINLDHIELSTGIDNKQAQDLYRRCGFELKNKKALVKVIMQDEVRWDPAEDPDMENAERYAVTMRYIGGKNNE